MISDGSSDTEDWSKGWWKSSFSIMGTFLNILKLKTLFKIVILMCSIIDQMKAKRDIQIWEAFKRLT